MELNLAIQIMGLLLAMMVQTFILVKGILMWVESRMDKERAERLENEEKIFREINNIKEIHVRRDDFLRHVDQLEQKIIASVGEAIQTVRGEVNQSIHTMGTSLNQRLDTLISALSFRKGDRDE
jgi:hypothetical protein